MPKNIILFVFLVTLNGFSNDNPTINMVQQNVISELNTLGPEISYDCRDSNKEVNHNSCPQIFKDRATEYFGDDFLGIFTSDTPWRDCRKDDFKFHRLHRRSQRIGQIGQTFEYTPYDQKITSSAAGSFEDYNIACLNKDQKYRIKLREKSKEKLVDSLRADFAYQSIRLKKSQLNSIESLAGIDAVLGGEILGDAKCENFQYPEVTKQCQNLKACQDDTKAKESMNQMVDDTIKALALIKVKEEEIKNASQYITPAKNKGGRRNTKEKTRKSESIQKRKEKEIESIRNLYTWMNGKKFKELESKIASSSSDKELKTLTEDAITQQLKSTRQKIQEKLGKEENATNCLRNRSESCGDYAETIAALPLLSKEEIGGSTELDHAQCLEQRINYRNKKNDEVVQAGTMAALTIASLAAAPLTGGLSIAASGAIQVGRVSVALAQAAVFAADATYAVSSFIGAQAECGKSLNNLKTFEVKNDHNLKHCPMAANPAKKSSDKRFKKLSCCFCGCRSGCYSSRRCHKTREALKNCFKKYQS